MGVSYGSIKLTFRRSKNRDFRVREGLVDRLKALYPEVTVFEARLFGQLATQIDGGAETLPFVLPTLESSDDDLLSAFKCWDELDETLGALCWSELDQLQKPADIATGPNPLPEDAQKNS